MNKIILLTFLSLTLVGNLCSQTVFEKSYPVEINNEFGDISQLNILPDSGYIFTTTAFDTGNNFILIGRLDKNGNTTWVKQIDGNNTISAANFVISANGFIYLTYSDLNGIPAHYFSVVLKMDMTGNMLWSKSYGDTTRTDYSEHIFVTSTAIYLAGETYSPSDLYLLKLDTAGNFLSGRRYNAGGNDFLRDAKQLSNGDILLSGMTVDSINQYFVSLFRVDTSGAIIWHNRFHLPSFKEFNAQAVNEDYDGTLLISGHADTVEVSTTTYFGKWDISLMKLSSTGNFEWGKIYGGASYDEDWEILPTQDHGFILATEPESFGNVSRISLMKTDSIGNIDWMRLYGKSEGGFPDNIVINYDKGYSILATDGSYDVIAPMVFIRTDSLGITKCASSLVTLPQKTFIPISDTIGGFSTLNGSASFTPIITNYPLEPTDYCQNESVANLSSESYLQVYPNPFSSNFTITIHEQNFKHSSLIIHNVFGQTVYAEKEIVFNNTSKTIDMSEFSEGIYLLDITIDEQRITKKIIKR